MNLIKTSFFTGIATLIKLFTGFIISKVIAVYVGPSGLAIVGQFQNFSTLSQTFAGSLIQSGVVKYTAENRNDELEKNKVLSTGLIISIVSSIIIGFLLFLFQGYISKTFLHSNHYGFVIAVFAFTIILFTLNTFLTSVLNGERDIKKLTLVNIVTSLVGLALTWALSVYYSVTGALLALVLNQSIVFFVTLVLVLRSQWFKVKNFTCGLDKDYLMKYANYALMTIISMLSVPISQMIIRSYIGTNLSWDDAGYWQAIVRISDVYLLLITTTLSVYYLPRLSEIKEVGELKREIIYGYKLILPAATLFAAIVFFLKHIIVVILFTPHFSPMIPLFKYQLVGDVLKIGSWLLGYLMLAKSMTKVFIITELVFSASYVLLSTVLLNYFGLQGITVAFAINYAVYWVFMFFIFRNKFLSHKGLIV